MERKLGEVFTYNSKTYQAVKGSECENCDIRWYCISASSIAGTCFRGYRSDNIDIIFKEINNMENNQLTIDISEGMEIDLENGDLTKGIVKFKQSTLKPKIELKPFDKVLVRDSKSDYWRATLFSHIDKNGCYYCVWASWTYCIPYEGNESLLGTTKDVEG